MDDSGAGIVIDDREDGRLLIELNRFNIPIHVFRLESQDSQGHNVSMGDAMFSGSGPGGQQIQIGIERKRLDDLVTCMKDRRLMRQLKDMREICQYERLYVVIEGIWKPSPAGMIDVMNGDGKWHGFYSRSEKQGITYAQVTEFIQSINEAGVSVVRTGSTAETAHCYVAWYRWWQKPYHMHKSMDGIYSTDPECQRRGKMVLHQGSPSPACQVAAQLPGIDSKAWSVAEQYGTIYELVTGKPMTDREALAAVERWQRTTWTDSRGKAKRFGKKSAVEIVDYLRREK